MAAAAAVLLLPRQLAVRLLQAVPTAAGVMHSVANHCCSTQLTPRLVLCVCACTGRVPLEPQAKPAPQTRATAGRCLRNVLSGRLHRLMQSARQSVCASLAMVGGPAPETLAKCALQGPGPLGAAHRPAFLAVLATAGAHVRPLPATYHVQCGRCYMCMIRVCCPYDAFDRVVMP